MSYQLIRGDAGELAGSRRLGHRFVRDKPSFATDAFTEPIHRLARRARGGGAGGVTVDKPKPVPEGQLDMFDGAP